MTEKRYNLVFEGKIARGQTPEEVKKKLGAMLKLDAKGVGQIFSGRPVIIKKELDPQTAAKYKQAFESAGAVARLEETAPAGPESSAGDLKQKSEPKLAACPHCGYKQRPAAHCIKCGAVMDPAAKQAKEAEMMVCPACGYRQRKAESCMKCGVVIAKYQQLQKSDQPKPLGPRVRPGEILLTNIETIPGLAIVEHYGLVSGNTIRAKNVIRDILASLKNLIGGELKGYSKLLQDSREQAIERMKEQARQLGANAVVNVRFSTSSVTQGAAELYAYGTAVKVAAEGQ